MSTSYAAGNPSQYLSPTLAGAFLTPVRPPAKSSPVKVGLAMRFLVEVDGLSLGHWQSCNGLKVDFRFTVVEEGGEYRRRTILPDHVEYGDVTLQRAVHNSGSHAVHKWLEATVNNWVNFDYNGTGIDPGKQNAKITVLDGGNNTVYEWRLKGVYPKSWSGPQLDGASSRVAVETLVFAYDGFDGWV